jgi:hypothetical protein
MKAAADRMKSLSNAQSALSVFLRKQDRQQKPTHMCLDGFAGGQLHIRDESTLYSLMARSIAMKDPFFLNELRTPFFRFFIDADMHMEVPGTVLTDEEIDLVVMSCIERVQERYPRADASVSTAFVVGIVADRPEQTLSVKSGNVHIHFPNLIVTSEEACSLAQSIAEHLPKIPSVVSEWTEAIDNLVYGPNGLRMVGSRKPALCPKKCKGLVSSCKECAGRGRVDVGRAYMMRACYTNGRRDPEWLAALQSNHALAIRSCSIRNETLSLTSTGARPPSESAAFKKKSKPGGPLTPKETFVQSAIRATNPLYAELVLSKCTELNGGELICADVDGVGSTSCPNLTTGVHSSSRIWFLLSKFGIRQGCRCKKNTLENRQVKCSEYKSQWMPMSQENMAQLFPKFTTEAISARASAIKKTSDTMHPATRHLFEHYQNMQHGELPKPKKRKREPSATKPPKRPAKQQKP